MDLRAQVHAVSFGLNSAHMVPMRVGGESKGGTIAVVGESGALSVPPRVVAVDKWAMGEGGARRHARKVEAGQTIALPIREAEIDRPWLDEYLVAMHPPH